MNQNFIPFYGLIIFISISVICEYHNSYICMYVYIYHNLYNLTFLLIHSVDGHLGYFYLLTIMNTAAVNINIQVSV